MDIFSCYSNPTIILFIQQFSNPVLDYFFMGITTLGNEEFYLIAIPILYWCFDKKFALKLGIVFLISAYLNDYIKILCATERPSEELVRVLYAKSGGGFAFPSGHTQNSAVFWGACAFQLKRAWGWIAAIVLTFLIGLSRLYLGVHWPLDVLGGFIIGAIILGVYMFYDAQITHRPHSLKLAPQIALIVIIGAVLFLINHSDTAAKTIGVFLGLFIGYLLEKRFVNFEPRSVWWYQALKIVLGLIGAFALKVGLKLIFPLLPIFDCTRYVLIGFWIAFAIPFFFRGRKR